jgi:hypothetical protein
MPIIRRNYVFVTLGTCYSVWMTVWYAEWNSIPPSIPDSHPHRITSTKCHINTVVSPDDGHIVARNTQRIEINIQRKIVHQVCFIYKMKPVIVACHSLIENSFHYGPEDLKEVANP